MLSILGAKAKIIDNEHVQCHWSMVSANWEKDMASLLLEILIDDYIKIRGHSTASAWLEKYKRNSKKSVQESKGVLKQLILMSTRTPSSSKFKIRMILGCKIELKLLYLPTEIDTWMPSSFWLFSVGGGDRKTRKGLVSHHWHGCFGLCKSMLTHCAI